MDWREPVRDYCERLDGGFWAEPLNATTNAAFLIAAAAALGLLLRRRQSDPAAAALIAVTASVGVGSFLFHTLATRGAMLLDVIPIAIFIYGYFLLALRRFFGLGVVDGVLATLLFGLASFLLDSHVRGLNGSVAYLPALAAIAGFATLLWRRRPEAAHGLAAAGAVFSISLVFRTMDRAVCPVFSPGAHFLWHVLNACVLWLLLRTAIMAHGAPDQATPSQKAREPTAA
ncbi:MAG: ceramidase domain-containing protein [Methylocystis sp.]|uniref:ceramidase domain-containing protein n=1 Tax=Methylocystis sp. TaxID=1911079 RepID=UPI003DA536D2